MGSLGHGFRCLVQYDSRTCDDLCPHCPGLALQPLAALRMPCVAFLITMHSPQITVASRALMCGLCGYTVWKERNSPSR